MMKTSLQALAFCICLVFLLAQVTFVSAASSASSSLSAEELLQSIEASEALQRAKRAKTVSAPQKLTSKQKADLRQRKRKKFTEMLSKMEKARESIRKQIELRQKKGAQNP